MNEAKTIVKFGRIYTIADIVNRAAGIILIPLYTHVLSISDYGIYILIFSVTDVIGIIIGVGLAGAMVRFYFDYSDDSEMRNKVISTTMLGFISLGTLVTISLYPLSRPLVEIIFGSAEYTAILALAMSGVIFTIFLEIETRYFLIQKQAKLYLVVSAGKASLLLTTSVFFVYYLEMGILGIVVSTVTSFAVLSIVIGFKIFRKVGFGFSLSIFKQLLSFGLPLIPSAFANTGALLVQRYYLNALVGPAAVGIVGLASRLASLLTRFIAAPFQKIFSIRRFETLSEGKRQSDLNQILLIFVAVVSAGGLFLGLFGNEIIYIVAPDEYENAALYIPLLCLSAIITIIEKNFETGLVYQKKTKVILLVSMVVFFISVPSNYYLISFYGPMGAVLAFLLVRTASLAMKVKANSLRGVPQIQLNWTRAIIILTLVSSISTLGYQYWGSAITAPLIMLKLGLLGFFIISLIVSPLLDEQSRKTIIFLLRDKTDKSMV